jgi:hypothetical protein
MIPISSAISSGLTWSKLPRSRNYELKHNGEVVGTLEHPRFGSPNFEAEAQDGRWTFRRTGFCGTGAEIVDSISGRPIATFKSTWGGRGILAFADGQAFHLECKGWWHPVWAVVAETGQPVLRTHPREKTVELPAAAPVPVSRLSPLIMFAWSRVLQAEEDAAAAVAVIAAS